MRDKVVFTRNKAISRFKVKSLLSKHCLDKIPFLVVKRYIIMQERYIGGMERTDIFGKDFE